MIFLEYFSEGESHSGSNSASLAMLLKKYENETFYLFCSIGHYNVIKKILDEANISTDRIKFCNMPVYPKKLEYERLFIDFKMVKTVFDFAECHNEAKIYSSYTTTVFLIYLKIFLLMYPEITAVTTLHSELERLYIFKYAKGFSGIKRLPVFLYILFFSLYLPLCVNLKNYKCLVYGESIKNNLLKKIPFISRNSVIAVNHPCIINKLNPACENIPLNKQEFNFGIIGLIMKKKNGINLKKLLNFLNEHNTGGFKITLIGHIADKLTENFLSEELKFNFVSMETSSGGGGGRINTDLFQKNAEII